MQLRYALTGLLLLGVLALTGLAYRSWIARAAETDFGECVVTRATSSAGSCRPALNGAGVPGEEQPRVFDGVYYTSFEVEAFSERVGCGGGDPDAYWVEAAPGSGFYEAVRAYRAAYPDQFPRAPFGQYHVRFAGHLSPPGHYGHLAGYARQVTVEQILDVGACPVE